MLLSSIFIIIQLFPYAYLSSLSLSIIPPWLKAELVRCLFFSFFFVCHTISIPQCYLILPPLYRFVPLALICSPTFSPFLFVFFCIAYVWSSDASVLLE